MRVWRCFSGAAVLAAVLLPACSDARRVALADDADPPVRGGTLKIVGNGDVDHLATTSSCYIPAQWLFRTFTRQLLAYPAAADFETASTLAPDLADTLPTKENGGISADTLTYTFHLRRGARWNTKPPREVTAHDVIRGIKMLGNPVNPACAPSYYKSTILGMKEYWDAFSRVPGTIEEIRRFVETRDIKGVQALDDTTVVFRLAQPATDFLSLMAATYSTPIPSEYLDYLPDSPEFRRHTISDGPYQIVRYTPNREILMERNPAWDAASDPLRAAYVDRIRLTLGMDAQLVQLQLEAGTADLSFDNSPPTAELTSLLEIGDPNLFLAPPDRFVFIYGLVINHVGKNNGGALQKLKVRQALEYAVDKTSIVQLRGGPRVARPIRQVVASALTGYRTGADWYVTPNDRGDPVKARMLLAEAGYPNGLSLRIPYYSTDTNGSLTAQSLQESLHRAGIELVLVPISGAAAMQLMSNPENAYRGAWDIATLGWVPDWYGGNTGRSAIEPIFNGRNFVANNGFGGGYNSSVVNALIDRALGASDLRSAESLWAETAVRIMEDAAFVPLVESRFANYHSDRTRNCTAAPIGLNCDLTSVWLSDAAVRKEIP